MLWGKTDTLGLDLVCRWLVCNAGLRSIYHFLKGEPLQVLSLHQQHQQHLETGWEYKLCGPIRDSLIQISGSISQVSGFKSLKGDSFINQDMGILEAEVPEEQGVKDRVWGWRRGRDPALWVRKRKRKGKVCDKTGKGILRVLQTGLSPVDRLSVAPLTKPRHQAFWGWHLLLSQLPVKWHGVPISAEQCQC